MKMNKKVILFASALIVLDITICLAGPFGFFGRGSGGCANGVCNVPTPDTTPDTPVVVTPVEKPDNILLHVPKVVKNEILTKPLCDSKKTCEACPIKTKPVVKQEQKPVDVKKDEAVQQTECAQPVQQYEYYERPRIFRRIFSRR